MTKTQHTIHLLTLVAILIVGVVAFFYAQGNRFAQLAIGIVTVGAYLGWGMMHHSARGDLHRKVVVEYLLMAMMVLVLLITVLAS